ncbi:type IIG restriction enzyme/methyltransferase [Persicitalea jodogahamensis]|uniref:site-specific DNA-methyltransferase (adenine-specific) n=1 Tax=Persicitalea jodogahamensis TaxID=402147 RepID=A0A8J3D9K3_9BACT|nr:TaqI-like C-terminal specificity domain-containing protein [Persicitalea jodogahamensis]GHB72151.1 type II restriction endonuclease [Persicitalea jodogahamensis]
MQLTPQTPSKSLDPAYKLRPEREQINRFKDRFKTLFGHIDEKESEENVKDHLMDFLKEVYYKDTCVVAPKGKTDFVIHLGKDATSPAGVLFEVKRPANRSEMVSRENLNTKAFHELLLYYFQERTRDRNSDLRHCVVTNVYEWFIFDAALIDRIFYRNAWLKKEYTAWATGQKVSRNNDLFYNEIAKPFLEKLEEEVPFTYFDLRTYQKNVNDKDLKNDRALLPLYKILSPTHLLKLPAATDSNRLNPRFYTELLHLIGLEETKEGNKKVIRRKATGQRDEGSLLENTIIELETSGKLSHLTDPGQYGRTDDEQIFSVALELCITWINRILFLKLLESQLVKYHRGDGTYAFLNSATLADFDEVYRLFFRVLAKRPAERQGSIRQKFGRVPYLNSSLFEITELEDTTLSINTLDSSLRLPLLRQSVLRDHPAYRHRAELPTLEYLFAFLDAYDFASESGDDIQEKNRALINASVLGLIFEKINGYKDGSFYTPGFITEYMCRETIRKAVVQKFNDAYGWQCADFGALQDKDLDRTEANELINSLRICDPAVGSGHFLVSALNELIAIKSELRILQDDAGRRLKGYLIRVVNDELVVLDEEDDEPFTYFLQEATGKPTAERQRMQRVLFHEKQILIENCLFGVDINPNSVKICRLRLWIELLKNAYYTEESESAELETLPNIDINIKQGNSLLSKFSLTEDLSDVFRKQKFSLSTYKSTVAAYKSTADKDAKAELLRFIHDIKAQFRETVINRDPRRKKLSARRGERILLDSNVDIFGNHIKDPKLVAVEKKRLDKLIAQIENEIAEVENNALYRGSFEWRFEFPEVLDEDGNYVGFDVVIGNPPYGVKFDTSTKKYLKKTFETIIGKYDSYGFFVEKGLYILKNNGMLGYIIPHTWLTVVEALNFRKFILKNTKIIEIDKLPSKIFDDAIVETTNVFLQKINSEITSNNNEIIVFYFENERTLDISNFDENLKKIYKQKDWNFSPTFNINVSLKGLEVYEKMTKDLKVLSDFCDFSVGIQAYDSHTGQDPNLIKNRDYHSDYQINKTFVRELNGKDVSRFGIKWPENKWVSYGDWLAHPRSKSFFEKPRILIREITGNGIYSIIGCYTEDYYINYKSILNIISKNNTSDSKNSLKYYLGLINSRLYSWYFSRYSNKAVTKTFPRISIFDLKKFPVLSENNFTESQQEIRQKIILLVESASYNFSEGLETTALEAEIDQLVYALYGLTAEEIALVEG